MNNEYRSVCDKCGGGNFSETQKTCSRSYPKRKECGTCGHAETDYDKMTLCGGALRPIDRSGLAPQFAPYLHDYSSRLVVRTKHGEEVRGYVGKTTGWKPVYLLLPRRDSSGSSEVLGHEDRIINVITTRRA